MQRDASRQIHVRVSADLKKAVKMFCVRTGTVQDWQQGLGYCLGPDLALFPTITRAQFASAHAPVYILLRASCV